MTSFSASCVSGPHRATTAFEEWRQAFILACQKLGVRAIPAHWNLSECWRAGDKPEKLAEEAKFWAGI